MNTLVLFYNKGEQTLVMYNLDKGLVRGIHPMTDHLKL